MLGTFMGMGGCVWGSIQPQTLTPDNKRARFFFKDLPIPFSFLVRLFFFFFLRVTVILPNHCLLRFFTPLRPLETAQAGGKGAAGSWVLGPGSWGKKPLKYLLGRSAECAPPGRADPGEVAGPELGGRRRCAGTSEGGRAAARLLPAAPAEPALESPNSGGGGGGGGGT